MSDDYELLAATRCQISEATAERMADARVWRRLLRDPRYVNAESAEALVRAEDEIESEVWAELTAEYDIT